MAAVSWPDSADELEALQRELALLEPTRWQMPGRPLVAGVFVASAKGLVGSGAAGDPLWTGAVVLVPGEGEPREQRVVRGRAGGPYVPGMLALREGELLQRAVGSLEHRPDVVLIDGTGRDHPRQAGIALHLGAVLDLPTVGVTVRPLVATPAEPAHQVGSATPLVLDGKTVGYAVRTRAAALPVFAHAAWRTAPEVARDLVLLTASGRSRTPEPIRLARRLARIARTEDR